TTPAPPRHPPLRSPGHRGGLGTWPWDGARPPRHPRSAPGDRPKTPLGERGREREGEKEGVRRRRPPRPPRALGPPPQTGPRGAGRRPAATIRNEPPPLPPPPPAARSPA